MIKQVWLNLPSKDLAKAKAFYSAIGFTFSDQHSNEKMLSMKAGAQQLPVMIFEQEKFREVIMQAVTDTGASNEMIISFDAETKQEVDDMAAKVEAAGGKVFSKPAELEGWMYNVAFTDPDGHRWNQLYMDMSKMPKSN